MGSLAVVAYFWPCFFAGYSSPTNTSKNTAPKSRVLTRPHPSQSAAGMALGPSLPVLEGRKELLTKGIHAAFRKRMSWSHCRSMAGDFDSNYSSGNPRTSVDEAGSELSILRGLLRNLPGLGPLGENELVRSDEIGR